MEITKTIFERYCPTLMEPEDETTLFDKMESFIDRAERDMAQLSITDDYLTSDALQAQYAESVCLTAAFEAVPHLDLVATPTGFGVVSNNNVSPASRERVNALREQYRQQRCEAFERLVLALIKETSWRTTDAAEQFVSSLLFLPCFVRRYGVTCEGATVYQEEFEKLSWRIGHAEEKLRMLISAELYDKLVALQLAEEEERTTDVTITIEQSRLYLATILNGRDGHSIDRIGRRLLETVRKAGFEDYLNSNIYAAQTAEPYANEQQHPTFFFS